jgi:hypothetical protein
MLDPNALSYWLPLLEAADLPMPKTVILTMPEDAQRDVWELLEGAPGNGVAIKAFAEDVANAVYAFGYPAFLRTDHTSGKHGWERTCFLQRREDAASHIAAIAEYSELAGMLGLPWDTWAVRELLPTIPVGMCTGYGNMPICREFRFFVEDGAVKCWHPYWPLDSLEEGGAEGVDYDALCKLPDDVNLHDLAIRASNAVPGAWSVDILETKRGWFITDMAEAGKSYHWPSCERLLSAKC